MGAVIAPLIFSGSFLGTTIVGSVTVGAVITAGINIGLSIGVSMLANDLFGPQAPKPQDVQGLIRQSVPVRIRHYGRLKVGGYYAFIETKGGDLYQIIIHGQGPFDGFEDVLIDTRLVELDGDGGVTTSPYSASDQQIDQRGGTGSQTAFGQVVSAFPALWTTDHRLRGIACSFMLAGAVDSDDFQRVYPNRLPALQRIVRGCKCYDPRDGSTAWTQNFSLMLRDYLTHPDGMNLPDSWVDDDLFGAAADDCDDHLTDKAGTSIRRYWGQLSYALNEEPKDVIGRFILATDGRLFLTGQGKIGFQVGKWQAPTVTINDEHLLGYEMTDGSGPFREVNQVILKYTQVEAGYVQATAQPWRDEDSISALGDERTTSPEVYEIQSHNHARRIEKIIAARGNPRWTGTIITNLHGLNAWDQRWIHLTIADLDIDESFEIVGPPSIDPDTMQLTFQVISFGSPAYAFNAATEEGTAPTVPDNPDAVDVPEPTGLLTDKVSRKIATAGGNDVNAYFGTLSWDAPPRKSLKAEAQYSLDGGTTWLDMSVGNKSRKAETPQALPRPSTVDFQMRFRTSGGICSDWVAGTSVSIPS